MGTIITYSTLAGVPLLVITGDGVYSGCTYNRLDNWYGVDNVDLGLVKRPGAPGAFAPSKTDPGEKVVSVEGSFFGSTRAAALQMREDLTALYNDGEPIRMTVADDLRTTSRQVLVESVTFPWTIHPEFDFSIDLTAEDPRRYGASVNVGTALATAGTGLTWPVVWPVSWGTVGVTGRVTIDNLQGNTETLPSFLVSGGEMPDGFEIVNVTTGERIPYVGPLVAGTTISLDANTRTALINGTGPGNRYLSSPQWFGVPKRSAIEVQFLARGAVTGSPRLDVYTAPAFY